LTHARALVNNLTHLGQAEALLHLCILYAFEVLLYYYY